MNSLVCVDANLVVRSLVYGPFSEQAITLLRRWSRQGVSLIAPSLLVFEVASTLRRLVYLREITPDEGAEAFRRFLAYKIRLSHRKALLAQAWDLSIQYNRPRTYDTAYLALARMHGCDFWTADEKLFNAVKDKLSWVHWIGEGVGTGNGGGAA